MIEASISKTFPIWRDPQTTTCIVHLSITLKIPTAVGSQAWQARDPAEVSGNIQLSREGRRLGNTGRKRKPRDPALRTWDTSAGETWLNRGSDIRVGSLRWTNLHNWTPTWFTILIRKMNLKLRISSKSSNRQRVAERVRYPYPASKTTLMTSNDMQTKWTYSAAAMTIHPLPREMKIWWSQTQMPLTSPVFLLHSFLRRSRHQCNLCISKPIPMCPIWIQTTLGDSSRNSTMRFMKSVLTNLLYLTDHV